MVRATIFVSAVFALVAAVSAAPTLVGVKTDQYTGVGNINAQGAASHVVEAQDLHVQDAAQNIDALNGDGHGHGVLGNILKREDAPMKITKVVGDKGKKMMAKKMDKTVSPQ